MNKIIKNKKGFWIGVLFLLFAVTDTSLFIVRYNNIDTMRIIKSIILNTFCILFGVTEIYRGINSKCATEDAQNDDERERLLSLKAESSAFKFTLGFCIIITILLTIALGITKYDGFVGILVGIGVMPTIMIFSCIGAYFYHNKRN